MYQFWSHLRYREVNTTMLVIGYIVAFGYGPANLVCTLAGHVVVSFYDTRVQLVQLYN